ncbi:MAG: hypothetical protein GY841_15445 [FCB group bacterium]|nr:hypothetical protein [FCB group bacterium]
MTAIFTEAYNFTERDFTAADLRLRSLQNSVFPDMTDPDSPNLINLLRSYSAWMLSRNDFYISKAARESFIATMQERRSAIYHGRRQGYTLSGAVAAAADLTVTITNGPMPASVTFSQGDIVKTQEVPIPIIGEIQSEVVIVSGETTATLAWKHAQSKQDTYTSTGKRLQYMKLQNAPYLDGSAEFQTAAGTWTEVQTFLNSGPTDRHYRVIVDEDDFGWIYFGDDTNGAIPLGTFNIDYEIGGGESGNVAANTLTKFAKTYTDANGNQVVLTVTNADKAAGGDNRETVAAARVNIPENRRLGAGTITREDFELRALTVNNVARALMLSSGEDYTVPENEGRLYIVPNGGGTASSLILDAVETLITVTYPQPISFTTSVISASYLSVDIMAVIYLAAGANATSVKTDILSRLSHYFEPIVTSGSQYIDETITTDAGLSVTIGIGMPNPFIDFGYNYKDQDGNAEGEIPLSDIYNTIRDTAGVRKIGDSVDAFLLNGDHSDIPISNYQFPSLGVVTLINGTTGNEI